MMVVATARDGGPQAHELSAVIAESLRFEGCSTIRLRCLDLDEIDAMRSSSTVAHVAPAAVELLERTGGNAFFLTQVLRSIKERDAETPPAGSAGAVPDTVVEVVRSRLAQLPRGARTAVEFAAVLGTTVDRVLLDQLLTQVDDADDALDELVDRHLLVESVDGELSFVHGIVRDATHELLPGTRRRRLHLQVARLLTGSGDDRAALLADHLEAADDVRHSDELIAARLRSASFAAASFDYERSAHEARRALSWASRHATGPALLAANHLALGGALRRTSDLTGACEALTCALDLARRSRLPVEFAEAVLELVAHGGRGAAPTMPDGQRIALLDEAIERLGDADTALAISLWSELGLACMVPNLPERTQQAATRAAELADAAGPIDAARGLVATRLLLWQPQDADRRRSHSTPFIEADPPVLTAEQRARVRMWRLADSMELGDRAGADRELAALCAEADQLQQPYWSWIAATWAACHRFVTGDVDAAMAEASAATARLAGLEHPEAALASAMQVAIFEIHRGRGAEMVDLWRMAVDVYPQTPSVACGYALVLAESGELTAARQRLAPLVTGGFAAIPQDGMWSVTMAAITEAACLTGDRETARALIPMIAPFHDRFVVASIFGAGACWGPAAGLLGDLHALVGDDRAARRHYDDALRSADVFGAPTLSERIRRSSERLLGT